MKVKTIHLMAATGMAAVLTLGAVGTASPVTVLNQGFENAPFTNGTTIGTSVVGDSSTTGGGWNTNNPSTLGLATLPTVTTEQAHAGSQSLKITRSGYDDNGETKEINYELYGQNTSAPDASELTTGHVITSFYVYMTGDTSGGVSLQFVTGTGLTNPNPGVSLGKDGKLVGYDYDDGNQTLETGLTTDKWYGIKFDVHLASKTYDVYLDSGSGFTKVNSSALSAPDMRDTVSQAVTFKPKGDYTYSFYVDDVNIQTVVPEPASVGLALVGFGGLMLMRRRRLPAS